MSTDAKPFCIEYIEEHVAKGKELPVFATDALLIRVLDVTPVGDEMRWRVAVMWPTDSYNAHQRALARARNGDQDV